jgi:hypothetical protein
MAGRVAAIFSAGGISRYTMVADSLEQGRRLHSAARNQIEVNRSLSVAQNARTQTEQCYFKASRGINVALPDLVCKGNLLSDTRRK